ncbi:MAG: FG-GAP repeat protein, partial [Pseudomonadota bacterium]
LIGAPLYDANGASRGAAYLFDPLSGAQLLKIVAPDGALEDRFGLSVALAGDLLLIGAPDATVGGQESQGAAYLFRFKPTPIPLPASVWLLLSGFGALALLRRLG